MKAMKSMFASLITSFALAAAAAGPFPPRPLPPPPPPDPMEQKNLSDYYPSIQSAISAYFNTLGVAGNQARKGLVIPWVATAPIPYGTVDLLGRPETKMDEGAPAYVHGYAVALGKTAGDCPLFAIQGVDERDIRWRQQPATPMAFPPQTAICPKS